MKEKDMKEKVKGPWPGTPTTDTLGYIPPLLNHNQRPRWLIA